MYPATPGARASLPAHALLTRQTTLDHLLFVYRTRTRFLARETIAGKLGRERSDGARGG